MRSRDWCFTLNNYTEGEVSDIDAAEVTYLVYGKETGENGTPHLQGYVRFRNQRKLTGIKKIPGFERMHLEVRRGPIEKAIAYCKKDGNYHEIGEPPMSQDMKGRSEKERWEQALSHAKKGHFDQIPADIYIRHFGNLERIATKFQAVPESIERLDCWWLYGPTGTGKSRTARESNPGYYLKMPNRWWDGYVDQPCVIIEEWSPCHEKLACHLKQWCDHHAFSAEVKGSTKCIRPRRIVVTSNYSIDECFPNPADSEPMKRRFREIFFCADSKDAKNCFQAEDVSPTEEIVQEGSCCFGPPSN